MRTRAINPVATDEELAAFVVQREESVQALQTAREACLELYRRHAPKLLAFLAPRAPRSDLEDIHQAVWERVWQHLPKQFRGGNFRAWLFQIARHYLIDQRRRKTVDPLSEEVELPDLSQNRPEEILLERERMGILQRCLERLDAPAAALVRARLAGESYEALCSRLELRPQSAYKLFHEAMKQLQVCVNRAMT